MEDINDKLREAASRGDTVEIKALLRDPGCDALSKDGFGRTALMHAAKSGFQVIVGILLPVSDALA